MDVRAALSWAGDGDMASGRSERHVVGSELEVQHRVPASSPVADLALCRGNLVGGRSYDEFGLR